MNESNDGKNKTEAPTTIKTKVADTVGGAIEKIGEAVAKAGAEKVGQAIYNAGDKIEETHKNPNHPKKV